MDSSQILVRKDSGIGVTPVLDQAMTPTSDYCPPDGDLGFPDPNWMHGVDSSQSSPHASVKVSIALAEHIPTSDWLAQVDASDELKDKRDEGHKKRLNSAGFKTTFLAIPSHYEG